MATTPTNAKKKHAEHIQSAIVLSRHGRSAALAIVATANARPSSANSSSSADCEREPDRARDDEQRDDGAREFFLERKVVRGRELHSECLPERHPRHDGDDSRQRAQRNVEPE